MSLKKKSQELGFTYKNKYKLIEPLLKDLYRFNMINTICEKNIYKIKEFTDFVNYCKTE